MLIQIVRNSGKTIGPATGVFLPPFFCHVWGKMTFGASGYTEQQAIDNCFAMIAREMKKKKNRECLAYADSK